MQVGGRQKLKASPFFPSHFSATRLAWPTDEWWQPMSDSEAEDWIEGQ